MSERRWFGLALQALVSALLIVLVVQRVDPAQLRSLSLQPASLPWLLAALLLFNLSKLAGASRLNAYQRHAAIFLSAAENLRLYYAGMFLNLFLPGGIGGDGYKILALHRRQAVPVNTLLRVLLADRLIGMLVLLLLLCLLAPLVALPWPPGAVLGAAAAGALVLAALVVLAHRRLLGMRADVLAAALACGFATQLLQLACMAALLASLQQPLPHYPAYLAVFLLSSVAAVLPLSVGGLGVREVVFLCSLEFLRLEAVPGIAAASGFFLITLASSLPGVLCLQRLSREERSAA